MNRTSPEVTCRDQGVPSLRRRLLAHGLRVLGDLCWPETIAVPPPLEDFACWAWSSAARIGGRS